MTVQSGDARKAGSRLPDLHYINSEIMIREIALALTLRFGANGLIHCWKPESHHNGDRTASVGIRETNNTVKCFGSGCGIGPLSCVDLVVSVLDLPNAKEAGWWIAARFDVPGIPVRRHLTDPDRRAFQYRSDAPFGLLIRSGLWADLTPTARALAPVLLEMGEKEDGRESYTLTLSYRAMMRLSGVSSTNAVSRALEQLKELHWITAIPTQWEPGGAPVRQTGTYIITPRSAELFELANANYQTLRSEIEIEREMRKEARNRRRPHSITK